MERIITVSTHYESNGDLFGWHLHPAAAMHQQDFWKYVNDERKTVLVKPYNCGFNWVFIVNLKYT